MYQFVVFLHITGVFILLLGHGGSANVAFTLRRERRPERIRALLDLSLWSYITTYVGLLLLLIAGIIAGFMQNYWGQGWIWVSLLILVLIFFGMYRFGSAFYGKVREAVGLKPYRRTDQVELGPVRSEAEIAALLNTNQPVTLTAIGLGGILVILYLMMFKPF